MTDFSAGLKLKIWFAAIYLGTITIFTLLFGLLLDKFYILSGR